MVEVYIGSTSHFHLQKVGIGNTVILQFLLSQMSIRVICKWMFTNNYRVPNMLQVH